MPAPFQWVPGMHPIYSTRFTDSEQLCRESVIRAVKLWRAKGWDRRRPISISNAPQSMVEAIDGKRFHSGYSFACVLHHAWIIVRYGWRTYVAMSRTQYKRSLKRH